MKNAKDYIEETGQNTQRITSLAYWLTPEGLDNPIHAAMLRDAISSATDEEFKEAFDGATKEEAAQYLEQWELCYMSHWAAPELAKVIVLSDAGRNEALALRGVSLAQNAGELSEVFTPAIGIQWAMARGYLIAGNICVWCGVTPGNYGHPSNPLSPADAPAAKVEAGTDTSQSVADWKAQARVIADECFDHDTKQNTRDQLGKKNANNEIVGGYAYRVMEIMQDREIHAPRGRIDNAATIMREALSGGKWWANKRK